MPNEYNEEHRGSYRTGRSGSSREGRGGTYGHSGHGGNHGGERRGIPLSELDPTTTESSRKVIGCAIEVHKVLGPGYEANVYAAALRKELDAQGLKYKADHRIPVCFRNEMVGEVIADLFVDGLFLVSVAARPGPVGTPERMALRGKLKAAGLDLGLIINFAERRLKDGLVRVLNIDKINMDREDQEAGGAGEDGGQTHDFETGH
jgi:GxxExxY protein